MDRADGVEWTDTPIRVVVSAQRSSKRPSEKSEKKFTHFPLFKIRTTLIQLHHQLIFLLPLPPLPPPAARLRSCSLLTVRRRRSQLSAARRCPCTYFSRDHAPPQHAVATGACPLLPAACAPPPLLSRRGSAPLHPLLAMAPSLHRCQRRQIEKKY